jgi:hypothetical protein
MDLTSLANVLIKAGAPILGGALGGPAGAAILPVIVKTIGPLLGLPDDATAEDVETAIVTNPQGDQAAQKAEAQIGKTALEIEAAMLETINVTMREEAKSESWGQRWWRPMWGIGSCFVWTLHGLVMAWQMARGDYALVAQIPNLTVYYGAALAVVGVYIAKRTEEKLAGVSSVVPALADAAAKAVRKAVR